MATLRICVLSFSNRLVYGDAVPGGVCTIARLVPTRVRGDFWWQPALQPIGSTRFDASMWLQRVISICAELLYLAVGLAEVRLPNGRMLPVF